MTNRWDVGLQQDFDNMTDELGTTIQITKKTNINTRYRTESSQATYATAVDAIAVIQELDSIHEMVQSGQMNVGDVFVTFQADADIDPEDIVTINSIKYKIIKVSKVDNFNTGVITHITATGSRLSER